MSQKNNPLRLNNLQLKTLTLLQQLAVFQKSSELNRDDEVTIDGLPQPHGNHFHIGDKLVMSKNATGLFNPSVWKALERKGLVYGRFPMTVTLTSKGLSYETQMTDKILFSSDHS